MKNILSIDNLIHLQNPWFTNRGDTPTERFLPKRSFFPKFKKLIDETKQISALIGMRRVGKTVLIRQILANILEDTSFSPLYFSFDQEIIPNLKNPLSEIINYYLTFVLKKKLSDIKKTTYLFFDEIQIVPFWQDTLKRYYDLNQNMKFVISGSSSLFLQEKSKESLAGRIFEQVLPPLTFNEYKKIKKIGAENEIIFFPEYLKYGGFFEELSLTDEQRKKEFLREWVLGKVLERDLPAILRLSDRQIFRILFNILLQTTGQVVVLSKIANELDLSPTSITNYVAILEKTLLLSSLFNMVGSFVRRERRLRKIYPSSSNFLNFLPVFPPNLGAMAETYAYNFLAKILKKDVFFFKERGVEIDFIIPEKRLAVEVKYQETIHKEDFKNLRLVMKKKKYTNGYLLTKNLTEEKKFPEGNIILIPVNQIEDLKI